MSDVVQIDIMCCWPDCAVAAIAHIIFECPFLEGCASTTTLTKPRTYAALIDCPFFDPLGAALSQVVDVSGCSGLDKSWRRLLANILGARGIAGGTQ